MHSKFFRRRIRIDVGPFEVAILVTAGVGRNPGVVPHTDCQTCAMVYRYETDRCNRTPPVPP
jgi:hypothetical protein